MAWSWDEYYKENKEIINANRREKYKNDKEYRESVNKRNREYWRTYKKGRCNSLKRRGEQGPRVVAVSGEYYCIYRVHTILKIINRSYSTVNSWCKKKIIPHLVDKNGTKWFFDFTVSRIRQAVKEFYSTNKKFKNSFEETMWLRQFLATREYLSLPFLGLGEKNISPLYKTSLKENLDFILKENEKGSLCEK